MKQFKFVEMSVFTVLLLVAFAGFAKAQAPPLLWAVGMGGGYASDIGYGITVDAAGNVYTTGGFTDTVDFDPGLGVTNLISAGEQGEFNDITNDVFVQKLDPSGNLVWAVRMGDTSDDLGLGVSVDAAGNVYTTGFFSGTADFDPGLGVTNLTSNGFNDMFVQKLDPSGNLVWAVGMGGADFEDGYGVSVDAAGNVYTAGRFNGTADFDPGLGVTNLTSVGDYDVFVQKLDPSGNLVWVVGMGGTGNDGSSGVSVDVAGNVYTTGNFWGTVDFDPGLGVTNLTSAGLDEVFVQKLDPSGNFVWAVGMGGTGTDLGLDISVDAAGNVYITGVFSGTADFDPGLGVTNLTSASACCFDVFVQKLDPSGNFVWAGRMGGTVLDEGYGISVDAAGNVYTTGWFGGTVDFDPGLGVTNLTTVGTGFDVFVQKLGVVITNLPPGTISGTVSVSSNGLENVLVILLDKFGLPVDGFDDVYTGENGEYSFIDVPEGDYQVMIVEPLGYSSDENPKSASVVANETSTVDFVLTEIVLTNTARSKGYWKHQFDVYVTNKGNAEETEQALYDYIDLVHLHYTLYYDIFTDVNTFEEWQTILSLKGNQPMVDRAKQHLAALIMNMVSNKIGQYTVVTDDGRDVGDVIQYVSELIIDGDDINDELAKDLAESINNQQMIASGIVPEGSILFKQIGVDKILTYELFNNYPNPFNPATLISFSIPNDEFVSLKIYDVLGREVAQIINERRSAGTYQIEFNASSLNSGVYYYTLTAGSYTETKKMMLVK